MKKTKLIICLLTTCLLFLLFSSASAYYNTWVKEGDHLLYYRNDTPSTGLQTIDNHLYRFSDEGWLVDDGTVQQCGSEYYYPDANGTLQYGWQTVAGNKYYFDEQTGQAYRYQYTSPTYMIDGVCYLFNGKGQLVIESWYNNYYGNSEGKVMPGYQYIDGYYFFFDEYGNKLSGFHEAPDGIHYFIDMEYRGWLNLDNDWYYLDENTGVMQTGDVTIHGLPYRFYPGGKLIVDGKMVLYDSDKICGISDTGSLLSGWQTIGDYRYYFDKYAYTGMKYIGYDGYYLFDNNGHLQSDCWFENYYFDAYGKRVSGLVTIDGYTYYFNDTYCTGKQYISGSEYYFDQEGHMKTCFWLKEGAKKYYYGQDGTIIRFGWHTIDGDTYYFRNEVLTGKQYLDGLEYFFDQEGRMKTCYWLLDGTAKYYYGQDGKRVSGWQTIDGKTYYFSPSALKGSQRLTAPTNPNGNYNVYIFNSEGVLLSDDDVSEVEIDGLFYRLYLEESDAVFLRPADKKIKTLDLPRGFYYEDTWFTIWEIADSACRNMKNLTTINLKYVTDIGKNAFSGCAKLKSVIGGKNIETIADKAFSGCKSLTGFTFYGELRRIGKEAFSGCKALKTLVFKTKLLNESRIGKNAFKNISADATVKCPKKKLDAYRKILVKNGKVPETAKFTK